MASYPKNDESLPLSRYSETSVVGRLIAMPTTPQKPGTDHLLRIAGYRNVIAFDFPSMPDVIDLARSTDYYVNYNPIMPDGMHQYRGTRPLEIPLNFKLHAMDKTFCRYGSLTLLQLAARLHSFVLPITSDGQETTVTPVTAGEMVSSLAAGSAQRTEALNAMGAKNESQLAYDSNLNSNVYSLQTTGAKNKGGAYPPVTCFLNLIWVSEDQPGISCIGYVKDVRARLYGPWLKGSNGEYNLPTWGEYELTFVHRPSHRNDWGMGLTKSSDFATVMPTAETQAFATDVRNRLYNTRNLVTMASYRGFDTPAESAPAEIIEPATDSGGNDARIYKYINPA